MNLTFSPSELRDLLVAWAVLGFAFAIFFAGGGSGGLVSVFQGGLFGPLVISLLTAGLGFLLHELAHKVVAVRFDQIAEFRADYGMLFLAVMSALVGFIFAAPGAVHHRGHLTEREHGLIALAGPMTNLLLSLLFVAVLVLGAVGGSPIVRFLGARGLAINLFLAAFNMLPVGSLDGRTVLGWSKAIFVLVFVPAVGLTLVVVFGMGIGLT